MRIDHDRLRGDIEANAQFGTVDIDEGHGRTVWTGTDADKRARDYFVGRLEDAGLDVSIDAVGNICGRWVPPSAESAANPVVTGSHLDSVTEGGIFDGPLGVYAGLEAVRAMQAADIEPLRPIHVVCFTEEEGGQRFSGGMLGSSVATGGRPVEEALAITDSDDITLKEALERIGYHGDGRLDAAAWNAWFELHIEQNDTLDTQGIPVGVETIISGQTKFAVEIRGEADHAPATPMSNRNDALVAAAEFITELETVTNDIVNTESDTAVGTVGEMTVEPNNPIVIPGRVELEGHIGDTDADSMEQIIERAQDHLNRLADERPVETRFDRLWGHPPVPMAERCRSAVHRAGEQIDIETVDLHAGAAHDSMYVADVTDTGLVYAPSENGISHSPLEWTEWSDCVTATQVLAGAIREVATGQR